MSCVKRVRSCISANEETIEQVLEHGAQFIRKEAAKQGIVIDDNAAQLLQDKLMRFVVKQGIIEAPEVKIPETLHD